MPAFGSWSPDLPPHGHDGLVLARNVYSGDLGFEPIKAPSAVTAALPLAWKGGAAFVGAAGSTALLAGTTAALYTLTATAATSVFTVTAVQWFFTQFGDIVVCVNGAAPTKYNIGTGVAAALGGTPPVASMATTQSNDFVFLAGNTSATSTVYWSGQNNSEQWTPGTNQSGFQLIPDDGPITGLAGGEYVLAFQAEAICVFEYVGAPIVFSRRKVVRGLGSVCHGAIAQHGRQTFFLSRRGFYKFVDGEVIPIGRNKVDRTFRSTYTTAEIENNIRCSVDPERSLVMWSMPDRLWIYNFENEKWSDVYYPGLAGISSGVTASLTLEQIAVTFPSIEDVTPALDDPIWRGGAPMLLLALTDKKLYSFGTASALEATFQLTQQEFFPGRQTHVRTMRLIGDTTSATVSVDCRARMGDLPVNVTSSDFRANGDVPVRASGRYLQPKVILAAGAAWSFAQGLETEATPGGKQ